MTLLQMSLSGALMILTVALIRALAMHHLPKRLFPALWGFVLARLLIPFSLPAPVSLFRLLRPWAGVAVGARQAARRPSPTLRPRRPSPSFRTSRCRASRRRAWIRG